MIYEFYNPKSGSFKVAVSYCLTCNFKKGQKTIFLAVSPPKTVTVISCDIWTDGKLVRLMVTVSTLIASALDGSRLKIEVTE